MSWKIKILLPLAVLMLVFSGIALAANEIGSGPQTAMGPMMDPNDMTGEVGPGDCPSADCAQYSPMNTPNGPEATMTGDMAGPGPQAGGMAMPEGMASQMTPPEDMGMPEEMTPMMTPPADMPPADMPMGPNYGQPASGGTMMSSPGGMDSTGGSTGSTGDMGPHMETGTMGTGSTGSSGPSGDSGSQMGGTTGMGGSHMGR